MKQKFYLTSLCLISAILLVACQFQATTQIEPSGSGNFRSETGFSAEERQNLEEQAEGDATGNFCNIPATQGQVPSNVTVTEEMRGDQTWCVTTTNFNNLNELRELYEGNGTITVNRLEVSGNTFYYDVDINVDNGDAALSNYESATWRVIVPGTVTNHNATSAQSNTLTWDLTPQSGVVNLHIESTVPESGPNLVMLGIGAAIVGLIVLVVLVAGAVWFSRSRKPTGTVR
jgi:hypothetical protein